MEGDEIDVKLGGDTPAADTTTTTTTTDTPAVAKTGADAIWADPPAVDDKKPAADVVEKKEDKAAEQTPEQKAAAEKAAKEAAEKTATEKAAADKAEEERRAKLTPEEREAEDKAKAEAAKNANPEGWDDAPPEGDYGEFKAPEGVTIDPEEVKELQPLLKQLGHGQAKAQALMDGISKIVIAREAKQRAAFVEQNKVWHNTCVADKEIGGDEEKHAKYLGLSKLGLDKMGTPELRTFLKQTMLGNHPEIIRVFGKIGAMFKEDGGLVRGDPAPKDTKNGPDAMGWQTNYAPPGAG